jgi:prepilin-type N-terminal cleavage/methylation domain-containing protein
MASLRRRRRRASQAGFTLIELMISLVLFSFAIAGVLAVAVSMVNGYREQRLAVTTEGAARAAMNYLADALRGASPGVPLGDVSHTVTGTTPAGCRDGALTVVNNGLAAANSDSPDELYAVFASGSVVTTSTTVYDAASASMTVINASEIEAGDTLLITNYAKGHLVNVVSKAGDVLTLDGVDCSTGTSAFPAGDYPAGSVVVRAMRARFFIQDLDNIPTLFMDPDAEGPLPEEPLAEGIEDMQIAIAIDTDADNAISENGAAADDDEWVYNAKLDAVPATPLPLGTVRALRITLIARAVGQVTGVGTFRRPAAEDRDASGADDNYRRRVLTSVIEIRNLGGSP